MQKKIENIFFSNKNIILQNVSLDMQNAVLKTMWIIFRLKSENFSLNVGKK